MAKFKITIGEITWGAGGNRFSGGETKLVRGKSAASVAARILRTKNVVSPHETDTDAWAHGPQMNSVPEGHSGNCNAVIVEKA